jgi:3-phosphoshikimate 1-carboxyvinyltransferase
MGSSLYETDDGIVIEGGKQLKGTVVESYNDHIIAMTLSIAALIAQDETMIRKAQILDISFPDFFPVLNSL